MEREKLMKWISMILTFCFVVACVGLGHAALNEWKAKGVGVDPARATAAVGEK